MISSDLGIREAIKIKLELWKYTLKANGFCLIGVRQSICVAILARDEKNMAQK